MGGEQEIGTLFQPQQNQTTYQMPDTFTEAHKHGNLISRKRQSKNKKFTKCATGYTLNSLLKKVLCRPTGGRPRLDRWARIQFGAGTFWRKTMKNQPGTMTNQPGTMKNHGSQPKTMKNQETTLKTMETNQKP